ncbi:shTK domain protein [Ostertagia ostertagi]
MGYCILLLIASALVSKVLAQSCRDGGAGPCLGNMCPMPTMTCLTNIDSCCDNSQIIPAATVPLVTTVPPVITFPTIPVVTVATTLIPTTCVDRVNAATGVSDCASMASYCNNAVYYTLMTQQCPRTCGRCTSSSVTIPSTTCVDLLNPATGVSDCTAMASYCNNAAYYTLMTQQCPRTCGRCTSSSVTTISTTCVDKVNAATGVSNCAAMAGYCNNSAYYTLMTEQCPRTCGRCTSSISSISTTSSECIHFCTSMAH